MRPLAFIAVRTTGPDAAEDDITEIAALRVDPLDLSLQRRLAVVVVPELVGRALGEGEAFLRDALAQLEPVLAGAALAGHELDVQLPFLRRAWALHGHRPAELGPHRLDTASLAWMLCAGDDLDLEAACRALRVESDLERAVGRAEASLEIARRVILDRCAEPSEARAGIEEVLARVLDVLHEAQAELTRVDHDARVDGQRTVTTDAVRTRRVYVCHPFLDDLAANTLRVRDLCADLVRQGYLPLAPHLFLSHILDEATRREVAMRLCLELLDDCDEVRVYGADLTAEMREEIARAEARGLEVRYDYPLGAEPEPAPDGR